MSRRSGSRLATNRTGSARSARVLFHGRVVVRTEGDVLLFAPVLRAPPVGLCTSRAGRVDAASAHRRKSPLCFAQHGDSGDFARECALLDQGTVR
jgi:hypothetical protein